MVGREGDVTNIGYVRAPLIARKQTSLSAHLRNRNAFQDLIQLLACVAAIPEIICLPQWSYVEPPIGVAVETGT